MPEFEHPTTDGPPGFAITPEHDSGGVRVRVVGDLDLSTAPELDRVLDGLAGDGHARILLDLDGVDFMDSSGLAAVVHAHRSAERLGHRLTVSHGSAQVRRLFELTGMRDSLSFE